jgi:hypothetical protein
VTIALWIVQSLLALLFIAGGASKLLLPIEDLTAQLPLPGLFLRFIGLAELLGGLGLIFPSLLRVRPALTAIAALELVHVMLGATLITLAVSPDPVLALIPLAVGALAAFVAYGRWRLAPLAPRHAERRRAALQPAS